MTEIIWKGQEAPTREVCQVKSGAHGVAVKSVIQGGVNACTYTLHATRDWEFTDITISISERELKLLRTDQGWEVSGKLRPDLFDAREVDISASPLSNTLPIRRLQLAIGESAEITTAYIRIPELDVTADPQRYTRISENEYLYESRDSDFRRVITVDEKGFIVEYPGLFSRGSS